MRRCGVIVLAVVAVLTAAGVLAACGADGPSSASGDAVILEPSGFEPADYGGKPLVVNFFGSWCPPCKAEAADLATFAKEHRESTQFVGVAVNDRRDDVEGFIAEYGLDYPVVLDDNSLSAQYGVSGVPTTIFFAADGTERDRIVGAAGVTQFEESLARAQ